jgi:hypothetical protein
MGEAPDGAPTGGSEGVSGSSWPCCPKAAEEAEQEGYAHTFGAVWVASCPIALGLASPATLGAPCPDIWCVLVLGALPGWDIAQSGLATGLGHLGPLHCLDDGLAGVCAPH